MLIRSSLPLKDIAENFEIADPAHSWILASLHFALGVCAGADRFPLIKVCLNNKQRMKVTTSASIEKIYL